MSGPRTALCMKACFTSRPSSISTNRFQKLHRCLAAFTPSDSGQPLPTPPYWESLSAHPIGVARNPDAVDHPQALLCLSPSHCRTQLHTLGYIVCTKESHNCIIRAGLLMPSSARQENSANCDRSPVSKRGRAAEANGFVQCNSTPKYLNDFTTSIEAPLEVDTPD